MAFKPGDNHLCENKKGLQQSYATLEKSIDEGKRWAAYVFDEALRTTSVFLAAMA